MVRESHKKITVIVGVETEVLDSLFLCLQTKSRYISGRHILSREGRRVD